MEHKCDVKGNKGAEIKIGCIPYGGWYLYKKDLSGLVDRIWINFCPFCGEKLLGND